jgi:two-component system LytT family sensor kinase
MMEKTAAISAAKLQAKIGRTLDVIIDAVDPNRRRDRPLQADAPEIDGEVFCATPAISSRATSSRSRSRTPTSTTCTACRCAGLYLLLDRMDRRPLVIKMIVGLGAGIGIAILHAAGCWLEIAWSHPALTQPAGIVIARNFLFSLTPIALWAVTAITLTHSRLLQERDRMLAELRIATQEAQMRALRYQLNPHFLFNSLNSLSGMVWERDWRGAETMVIAFSEFLREVLASDPHDDVPLDRELEMQRKYLAIEEARFAGRLHIDFIVEPGLDSIAVPNLILQPLVENAIKHGVAPIAAPVTLTIAARRSGGRLRLTVENASVTVSPGRPGMGIGLANVRARLNGRFGNRAALIAQATRHGFIATVTLPLGPA